MAHTVGRAALVALLAAVASLATVRAAPAQWTALGPNGGIGVNALLVDARQPERVLAGTSGGLFVSLNGGVTWAREAFGGSWVNALATDPRRPDIVYAATLDGMFSSRDGGRTWIRSGDELHDPRCVALHPDRSGVLFAGTSVGVFRSDDGGKLWRIQTDGVGYVNVLSLAIDPRRPSVVYAGLGSDRPLDRLLKSVDGGATWASVGEGLPESAVFALRVDPARPDTLHAGTDTGIYASDDGGRTWRAVLSGSRVYAFSSAGGSPLLAGGSEGVWASDDAGETWSATALDQMVSSLAVDPTDPERVYAGDGAVFVSDDGGASYQRHDAGLTNARIHGVAAHPRDAGVVVAAARWFSVLATADGGASWVQPLGSGSAQTIVIDTNQPQRLFVGGYGWLARSLDGGANWIRVGRDLPSRETVNAVGIDPHDPDTIYVGLTSFFDTAGLYYSRDGGTTWASVDAFAGIEVTALAFDAVVPGVIYAGLNRIDIFTDSSVARSDDDGATWFLSSTGFDEATVALVVAIDGSLYGTGSHGGVFKSADGGANWSKLARFTSFNGSTSLAGDPADADVVYAAGGDVFRTIDGGLNWTALDVPYHAALGVAVAADRQAYVGTFGAGIFRFDPSAPAATQTATPSPTPQPGGDHDGCQLAASPRTGVPWLVALVVLLTARFARRR